MKKTLILLSMTALMFACNKDKPKVSEGQNIEAVISEDYDLAEAKKTAKFTAYKTTAKVGVSGEFKTINILENTLSNSVTEAITGSKFSIPVSSLDTKNEGRDLKIVQEFFGKMTNTSLITGSFGTFNDGVVSVEILFNGVSKSYDFTYHQEDKKVDLKGVISILDFDASKALESLNTICGPLHQGEDGVSKTWDTVDLDLSISF